ncbi:MAG: LD-carboxypeptidase [Alphaproteobacteria bacterium]
MADDLFVHLGCRGGNRALHILDEIDFDLIRENPKPLIGFSDVTVLLNGIYTHTGLPTIHGPVFKTPA